MSIKINKELDGNKGMAIYGHSDDLIEFESLEDDKWSEEFGVPYGDDGMTFGLSDGTVFSIDYDEEGVWRIGVQYYGSKFHGVIPNEHTKGEDSYSDILVMDSFDYNPVFYESGDNND